MEARRASSNLVVYSALVLIQVLFGMNYVISKVVVQSFPPLAWASFRICVASLVMLAICLALRRDRRPRDGWKFFGPMIAFALLGSVINQGSFLVGLRHTTSTNSAVLNTLIPVFTLLIVTLRGQEKLTWPRAAGFATALAGVLVIRRASEFSLSSETMIGDLLTVVNCLSFAIFLSYSKAFIQRYDRVWTTTWMFIYGTVGLSVLAIPDWMTFQWPRMSPGLAGCMAFAIIGGTLLTYFLNVWTLARANPSSVAVFTYIQPIVAAVLAWGWMGQAPTPRTLASSALIFTGMILALYSKPGSNPQRKRARREAGFAREPVFLQKAGNS